MAKWNHALPGLERAPSPVALEGRQRTSSSTRGAPHKLSALARHYLGGQVALMPELTALFSPTINSYKRYVPGVWAPLNASWGVENRTCAIRAIPGSAEVDAPRVPADRRRHQPVHRHGDDARGGPLGHRAEARSRRRRSQGDASARGDLAPLPRTLRDAIALLDRSAHARELLGEASSITTCVTRDWECRQYERAVTEWELERYFEAV